ncbi:MAG: Stp1/IreP family PP2C-type Ser/Thr phosphatase [Nitrospiraceae bacterium]|nr:Stp1/IreP family PP2C-type Ser/Thr phosphatase [Nitrospiraceae bacterium]
MSQLRALHGAKSDTGLRRRHNEDSFCADPTLSLFVVCDGMGGHRAGEVASARAAETIHRHIAESADNPELPLFGVARPEWSARANRLASAIRAANSAIHQEAARHPERGGMGTTVIAAWLADDILSIAHVGDSRLYLARGESLQPLTTDHSLVSEQIQQGLLSPADAERVAHRHVLTRAVGVNATVDVDVSEIPVLNGDVLLLCSDGLTAGVKPQTILDAVKEISDPQQLSERLIELSNAAGGIDNTTVIVVSLARRRSGIWDRLRGPWFANYAVGE